LIGIEREHASHGISKSKFFFVGRSFRHLIVLVKMRLLRGLEIAVERRMRAFHPMDTGVLTGLRRRAAI
jgi:hypothetical protein